MKQEWERFAPIGLVLGVLASITALAGYFVFGEFTLFVQISIGLAVLGFATYILLAPQQFLGALTGRQARHGSNALLLVIGVFGILAAVNYLAAQYPQEWDTTENDENTLAAETLDILGALPERVHIIAFYQDAPPQNLTKLFATYKAESNNQITYEYIDPYVNPLAAQAYGIKEDRTVVLQMGERIELLERVYGELELSGGLVKLMSENRKVYFLTGHGEKSVVEAAEYGYSTIVGFVASKGYELDTLGLLTSLGIPEDADVLVIAGPLNSYALAEVEMIAAYMEAGGSMLIMLDPTIFTNFTYEEDLLSSYLLASWGIVVGNDLVIDLRTESVGDAVVDDYPDYHPVNSGLENDYTVFPTARSIQAIEAVPDVRTYKIAQTAVDASWAETDLQALLDEGELEANEGVDFFGPVPVAIVAENTATEGRLVVIGDSDFLTNQMVMQYPANADLFLNAIDWTAGQENLLNLTPREQTQRFISMPFDYFDAFAALILIILIPGAFVVSGVLVWRQRRRRL